MTRIEVGCALITAQDAMLLGYLTLVLFLVLDLGVSEGAAHVERSLYTCIAGLLVACWCARAPMTLPRRARWVLYRVAMAMVLLLLWHYAVDVLAGLALDVVAGLVAPRLAAAEARWRSAQGFEAVWALGATSAPPSPVSQVATPQQQAQ